MLVGAFGELKVTREHDALHVVKDGEIQKYPDMLSIKILL